MTDIYNPFNIYPGVPVLKSPLKPAIEARIKRLGDINDRRKLATERRDTLELLQIAQEYEDNFKYMQRTAHLLRVEVAEMDAAGTVAESEREWTTNQQNANRSSS